MRKAWWMILFSALVAIVYFHFIGEKRIGIQELVSRMEEMEKQKQAALQKREDLRERIASQSDPAWIEMVLIRDLGVVPEGFLKVHFKTR